ncbi:MAG: putative manganese-dependent inorganic diphosphatase [Betaproteobacteria bacterium]
MSQEVLVIGHRNPDTDAIAAAIAYAWLKNRLWRREAEVRGEAEPAQVAKAASLGPPNQETAFVLGRFGLAAPSLVADLRLRVADVMEPAAVRVGSETTLLEIGRVMQETGLKSLPVTEEDGRLVGIVTAGDIAKKYLEERSLLSRAQLPLTVANLGKALEAKLLTGRPEAAAAGKVVIAAMSPDSLRRYLEPGDLVLVGDRPEAQKAALAAGAAVLVVTGGYPVTPEVVDQAAEVGAAVLSTDHDTYTAARLLNMSQPVGLSMTRQVVTFNASDLLDAAKKVMTKTKYRRYPVVDEDGRLVGMLSRGGLLDVGGKPVILVDHNERSQAAEGIEEAELLEVVDHHRLGDLTTLSPILFRNEPVGSTSTIVARFFQEAGEEIPPPIAGLLLAAILSDTLAFRSPTTTPLDRAIAAQLAALAGVEVEPFGREVLRAGTSLAGQKPRNIIREDFKEFALAGRKVGVAQVETMDMEEVEALAPDLHRELEALAGEQEFGLVLLMVTDLWRGGSTLYAAGPDVEVVEQAFGLPLEHHSIYLPGVMSRKKQVIPPLARAYAAREI